MSDLPRELSLGIQENLCRMLGRFPEIATRHDYYLAVAYTVRDWLLRHWVKTAATYFEQESRTVAYLSAEFLIGPQLGKNLVNLGIYDEAKEAVASLGKDLEELLDEEEEPGLGNGGLGRLAACYMESMATLQI
ncbi:MAG: glycogen/starch/alpha-glucan phosphorylase, partial [Pirellulales bacterium]